MILLGFDIEEFDMPLEYGKQISFAEQLSISTEGTNVILAILKSSQIKATFFCTANYAVHKPEVINQIVSEGHEIASHGYYHSDFKPEHLAQSKTKLEEISGAEVTGFRMARMMPVDEREIAKADYAYNSSINPTFIPGRYNNFGKPRSWFYDQDVLQIPASVSPLIRFPLFWLSFHNLPMGLLKWMSGITHKKDGYLNLYFHPWEFTNLNDARFGFPKYVVKNSGQPFAKRLEDFISWGKSKGYEFMRTDEFVKRVDKRKLNQVA
ncbi:polysaccharide deacetylase family protein [Mucilaginibacter sp. OK283]|jgi:peptidoglycan/xylan/chitin deacetylase (PgdA/CDA1 family)|uniref:polysaccharide deacetylase family protein n=1 Tax=Mucilaginibacter sp. OK283 TaxID=1881049 RepID=UPI0008C2A16A|nr:polysaccharide deacetylase family protein [Mucilaginibacter sp. OK283]SEP37686.1 Polysaccharide deacetylase [Mucilaginibacter sp. OK283]